MMMIDGDGDDLGDNDGDDMGDDDGSFMRQGPSTSTAVTST